MMNKDRYSSHVNDLNNQDKERETVKFGWLKTSCRICGKPSTDRNPRYALCSRCKMMGIKID